MRLYLLIILLFGISVTLFSQANYTMKVGENTYPLASATNFGPSLCDYTPFSATSILVMNEDGDTEACNGIEQDLTGKIAIIDRGVCWHDIKVKAAEDKGAIAVIMCDHTQTNAPISLFQDFDLPENDLGVTIPSFRARKFDCDALKVSLLAGDVMMFKPIVVIDPNPRPPLWEEDFSNGLDGWETKGIYSDVSGLAAADAVWAYSADGSTSKFTNLPSYITSKSACNGAAIFDFALYQGNASSTGAQIQGELISPEINFTNAGPVVIKFTQWNLPLNGGGTIDANFLSYTLDDGANWTIVKSVDTENLFTDAETNLVGTELVQIVIPELAGQAKVKLKFTASGDFYYWMIDDITAEELSGVDAVLGKPLYPIYSSAFPASYQSEQVFNWRISVNNLGAKVLDDMGLDIEIKNIDNDRIYFTESYESDSIVGLAEYKDIVFGNGYTPSGLDIGHYKIEYQLNLNNSVDANLSNNNATEYFEVTNNYFGKENSEKIVYINPLSTAPYSVLTGYDIPALVGASGLQALNTVFSVSPPSGFDSFTDENYVHIYLLKLKDGISLSDVDINSFELFSHPSMDYIADNFVDLEGYSPGQEITVFFNEDEEPIDLEPGGFYFVAAQYDGEVSTDPSVFSNSEISHSFSTGIDYSSATGFAWLYSTSVMVEGDLWYSTGFGTDSPAFLRLVTSLSTDVNEVKLDDGILEIYPNPASDNITIQLNTNEKASVVITDLEGRTLSILNVPSSTLNVNISQYPNGTYIAKILTEEGYAIKKFVVNR